MLPRRLLLGVLVGLAAVLALPVASASAATPFGPSAVVLVSGFNTSSPFSTPACTTAGRGSTWGYATGPAPAITAAGLPVFTAPVANGGAKPPASCLGGAYPDVPTTGDAINSNGAVESNGAALVGFLTFLNTAYGITSVQLVGHSDGGLWSREAITQLRASAASPIAVTSLTTMGTPHTGSYAADIGEDLSADGGSCTDLPHGIERDICEAFFGSVSALIDDLGPTVIEELSSPWLAQWNPTTTIGCPVTVVGGDHVGFDFPGLSYYTPNDGVVGEASALAQGTFVPFVSAPPFTAVRPDPDVFDVVHSPSLSFLDPNTLLNTASVTAAVLASVTAPPPGPCVSASTDASARTIATARASAAPPRTTMTVAFSDREAVRGGAVRRPRTGDAILLQPGATAACRGTALPAAPLLGSRAVRVVIPRCSTAVTIRGRAMRVGPSASGERLRLTRAGGAFRWKVVGGKLTGVRVQLRSGTRWTTVRGTRVIPGKASNAALRVRGTTRSGTVVQAAARLYVP